MNKTSTKVTVAPIKPKLTREAIVIVGLSLTYLLMAYILIGFKIEQIVLVLLANGLFFLSVPTRKFIKGFSIFILFWVLFDFMKAFPNYWFNPVHIQDLYNLEKSLFGIKYNGGILTPNEYWQAHT
ncbi:MAG: inositol phosphorylceramide synthase, partial [Bacteroidota bacterium]|nr:inositol phosphorylceramide synthase [Bacteroidota bacterium]